MIKVQANNPQTLIHHPSAFQGESFAHRKLSFRVSLAPLGTPRPLNRGVENEETRREERGPLNAAKRFERHVSQTPLIEDERYPDSLLFTLIKREICVPRKTHPQPWCANTFPAVD